MKDLHLKEANEIVSNEFGSDVLLYTKYSSTSVGRENTYFQIRKKMLCKYHPHFFIQRDVSDFLLFCVSK